MLIHTIRTITWGMAKMNSITRRCVAFALLGMAGIASNASLAGPLPTYSSTYPTPNSACATYGNFVSCSTGVLNYLSAGGSTGFTGDYTFSAAQGALHDSIVVASNGGATLANGDAALPSKMDSKPSMAARRTISSQATRTTPPIMGHWPTTRRSAGTWAWPH
ncbi:hypothetical protein [Massilia violaceinigra]|uniref:hypothetical protein n=1 Tax=Massilia violaceinigra TaxID=2045208 RepID=UPI0012FDCDD4|nr:hypothetical protein [Massilia violaceinigra]